MSSDEREKLLAVAAAVRATRPLVHCVTNYVTVNDCANAILAVGGSPVMADDPKEVSEIAAIANALVVNIGTLNSRTIRSMRLACKSAARLGKPIVLDPVGAGASRLRTTTAREFIKKFPLAVIRGNASEIAALLGEKGRTRGVDAAEADEIVTRDGYASTAETAAIKLSRMTGAVVVSTGVIDTVASGDSVIRVSNGHPAMAAITGSGCMLTAIIGAFCGAAPEDAFHAAAAAVANMGIAGEIAAQEASQEASRIGTKTFIGTGTFRVRLIDALSSTGSASAEAMRIEHA
ncbi:MAG TPA: hydroxyethylthiazole kinase [Treponemataceae bacterium]|nr:hydroxyethylthiazole kinase [Treponemataceae bacterium]